jgi:hypothetical protein
MLPGLLPVNAGYLAVLGQGGPAGRLQHVTEQSSAGGGTSCCRLYLLVCLIKCTKIKLN